MCICFHQELGSATTVRGYRRRSPVKSATSRRRRRMVIAIGTEASGPVRSTGLLAAPKERGT